MYAEQPSIFLLVEHNMEFVMSMAHDIIVMHQGRVLERGTPAQVQASSKVGGGVSRMTAVLHVQNLCASYGARHILDGVNLDVRAGEIVTVIGHNGAGKSSTLLRAIFNLVPWRSGTVELLGQDVTRLASDRLLGAGMAYVPQHRSVFPRLTIEENLQMGGYLVRNRQLLASAWTRYWDCPSGSPVGRWRARCQAVNSACWRLPPVAGPPAHHAGRAFDWPGTQNGGCGF